MKKIQALILLLFSTHLCAAGAPWVGEDLKGRPCKEEHQGYGPYDYTKPEHRSYIPIVEQYHFNKDEENHIEKPERPVAGGLDYTLRAVPNHHRALLSMIRYQIKLNKGALFAPKPLLNFPECYLQRAIHFSPNDAASVSLYAYYLKEIDLPEKAAELYVKALAIDPNNAKISYSYSLLLIDLKRYDEALEYAKKAYSNGRPPQGLKKKLIKLGVWKEASVE